jgi:hypothetical protein
MINTNKNNDKKLIRPLYANGRREPSLQKQPFHIVAASPWPFMTAQALTGVVLAIVNAFHYTKFSFAAVLVSLIIFFIPIFGWFRDIIRESTYMGNYTLCVQKNLRTGMVLFIVSEIMFFFSLF